MNPPPTTTLTFLFTDIAGSTRLWEQAPEDMSTALARHDELLRRVMANHDGEVFGSAGDSLAVAFSDPAKAAQAALAGQQALAREDWPTPGPIRVRMALNSGTAERRDGDYFGPTLNRTARLLDIGHAGQILASSSTRALFEVDDVPYVADLGPHRLRDLSKPEHVFQVSPKPATFPPLRSLDSFPHNLPSALTSFIGRDQEVAAVSDLIRTERLVTLTGVGGTGKTRLALQAAANVVGEFDGGVWWTELAPISDPELVPQAVLEAMDILGGDAQGAVAMLREQLGGRSALIVLDNCEHVLDPAADLVHDLLTKVPALHVVVTSREALAVPGESLWRVRSLSTSAQDDDGEQTSIPEAVALFADRASKVLPSFAVTQENIAAVRDVCIRLDGLPLAIELAAAKTRVLPIEEIAQRLSDRFRLLTGGSRTSVPRQQTLLAAVEWSYDLLSDEEKVLFARLAVFRGGFTLSGVEAVCADERGGAADLVELVTHLADKSLIVAASTEGTARFRMLETLRQFASDRLVDSGEASEMRDRHADHFLELAIRAEAGLESPEMGRWLDALEQDHDNLRTALAWTIDADRPRDSVRMLVALSGWFWYCHRHHDEAISWHSEVIGAEPDAEPHFVARAFALAAMHAARTTRYDRATKLVDAAEQANERARDLLTPVIVAWTRGMIVGQGRYEEARAADYFAQSSSLALEMGNDAWAARSAGWAAEAYFFDGQEAVAREHLATGIEIAERTRWPFARATTAIQASMAAVRDGDLERAMEYAEKAAANARIVRDPDDVPGNYQQMAWLAGLLGDAGRAVEIAEEGLRLVSTRRREPMPIRLRATLAENLIALGDIERAVDITILCLTDMQGSPYPHSRGHVCLQGVRTLKALHAYEAMATAAVSTEMMFAASFPPLPPLAAEMQALISEAARALGAERYARAAARATMGDEALSSAAAALDELRKAMPSADAR